MKWKLEPREKYKSSREDSVPEQVELHITTDDLQSSLGVQNQTATSSSKSIVQPPTNNYIMSPTSIKIIKRKNEPPITRSAVRNIVHIK